MREFPQGGLIGKSVHLWRRFSGLRVSLYAANASFFLVLAAFPGLLLLLGLLRYTPMDVERLGEMLAGFLPEALAEGAEELILLTYDNTSGLTLGLSAVTTLWSAGRGVYGMIVGLNAVYDLQGHRGFLRKRSLSVVYTSALLLLLVLTLGLFLLGISLLDYLSMTTAPALLLLIRLIDLRWLLIALVQSLLFALMYAWLPARRNRLRSCWPGAIAASLGFISPSILLITHNMGVVAQLCDYVYVMYAGQVVEQAETFELFRDPRHPYTLGLLKAIPSLDGEEDRLYNIRGSVPDLADLPKGCRFCPRCDCAREGCGTEPPALAEISPGHFVRCLYMDKE